MVPINIDLILKIHQNREIDNRILSEWWNTNFLEKNTLRYGQARHGGPPSMQKICRSIPSAIHLQKSPVSCILVQNLTNFRDCSKRKWNRWGKPIENETETGLPKLFYDFRQNLLMLRRNSAKNPSAKNPCLKFCKSYIIIAVAILVFRASRVPWSTNRLAFFAKTMFS